jgi:ABC-type transport system involved in multi-copper enzyme maturation permease subunit
MKYQSWLKQSWTIAKIELRRAFFSKRAFWVYGLALFPSLVFFGNSLQVRFRRMSMSSHGLTPPALIDSIKSGESEEAILQRLGKPSSDLQWQSPTRVRDKEESSGMTTHKIEPASEARFVRLNVIMNNYVNDPFARIYELEVYGDGPGNLALKRPATSSPPCNADEGPEKAFNGSVTGGKKDRWCASGWQRFLQVDLGGVFPVKRFVVKHASAGGENEELNTALFTIQASTDNKRFVTIVNGTGARLVDEITSHRQVGYFDGKRNARLVFRDGKLASVDIRSLLNFEEDRGIFAGVFQFFYLRLAIFFGCLGIFMNLFRGEMLDKTLHYWFLAPARREVLLAGKYGAGLIASTVIFAGGALLCFGVLLWTHNPVEVQSYWHNAGMAHVFWYMAASVLGCIGYGSVFLAAGLLMRNPIIPAAVILGWEGINGFLPEILQKASVLYYLQSLCPVPAPLDKNTPAILQLLLVPAEPASRAGAILGLLAVTGIVLFIARFAILRMQVSYSTET